MIKAVTEQHHGKATRLARGAAWPNPIRVRLVCPRGLAVVTTNVVQGEPGSAALPLVGEYAGGRGRSRLQPAKPAATLALTSRARPGENARQKAIPHEALPGMNNVQSNDT